jgi:prepilin-type N-terminal cleavage/methylation domain-containing protein
MMGNEINFAEENPMTGFTNPREKGFTLIELMVVIAIIAILAAIAIPQYSQYVINAKTTHAKSNLQTLNTEEQQYYQDCRSYAGLAGDANAVTVAKTCGNVILWPVANYAPSTAASSVTGQYFTYSITLANLAQNFTITATGTPSQFDNATVVFTTTDSGANTCSGPYGCSGGKW